MATARSITTSALAAALFAAAGCSSGESGPPQGMAVPVIAAEAKVETIRDEITVVGDLAADENVQIQSEMDGLVEKIAFEEGKPVSEGALLFKIDEQKRAAQLAEAEANFNLTETNLKRNEELLAKRTISSKEFDQTRAEYLASKAAVDRLKHELQDATVVAPFEGVVGSRLVSPGQMVRIGQTLTTIVKLDPLKAELNVPERFLGSLKVGQPIELSVSAYPERTFSGEVFFIAPQVNIATRTVLVKALVPNPEGLLRPGMLAEVNLLTNERQSVVIPESAVQLDKSGAQAFLIKEDGTVELAQVKVGKRLPGKLEIVDGIPPGARVVVEGTQKIRPGAPVVISRNGD